MIQHVLGEPKFSAQQGSAFAKRRRIQQVIPLKVPRSIIEEISRRSGVDTEFFDGGILQASPWTESTVLLLSAGADGGRFKFGSVDFSYSLTQTILSSEVEPAGRHVLGEICYRFTQKPDTPSATTVNYRATFDMHMTVKSAPDGELPDAVKATITWKGAAK